MQYKTLSVVVFVVAIALAGCTKTAAPGNGATPKQGQESTKGQETGVPSGGRQAVIPVQATTIQAGMLSAERNTAAIVVPATQSQVAALIAGIASKVSKQVGDWVGAGDIVVQLDDTQLGIVQSNAQAALDTAKINLAAVQESTGQNNTRFELQVKSSQASLDSAQRYYDSQKALYDLGGISAYTLDQAGNQLTTAQVALETAKTNLEQNKRGFATTPSQNVDALKVAVVTAQNNLRQAQLNFRNAAIRAPFAGQISAIAVSPGMYVGQNTAAFTLVSAQRLISFGVSPADAPALSAGKTIGFEYSGTNYSLRIKQAPSAPVNGTVPMVATPSVPFDLPFGSVGNIKYTVVLATGSLVPVMALGTVENRNYVYAVESGVAVQKFVSIIAESGAFAAVSGLDAGTIAIISPPPGLIQGSTVQPIMAQPKAAGASAEAGGWIASGTLSTPNSSGKAGWKGSKGAPVTNGSTGTTNAARSGGTTGKP